jgi:trimethylamine--corrinoid protein Co-methyltransferase
VQAGLTNIDALDNVIRLGEIVAGGKEAFQENPVLSFIACVVKSPLQIVDDTAETFMEVSKRKVPIVVSSCPMGGATGSFDEFGMVAQINAELLTGIALNQLVAPGAPVLYGAVPVRTRLDNLNDMYAAPEFNHYNIDCAQMARFYNLPCYSTAGVGDTEEPGIQATAEKLITLATVPWAGAQYIHYAFGLLERTNTFCPEQAIMDDAHIGIIKDSLKKTSVDEANKEEVLATIREVMESSHKTFVYHLPCPTREPVYIRYPLEDNEGDALLAAHRKYQEILEQPADTMPDEMVEQIMKEIPGIIPWNLSQ